MFYSLLRRCLTQAAGRQRQTSRQKSALRRRFSLPQLEALEDRVTPSATLTVLNSTDHDPGSLRAAVTSAVSGDTIKFASSVHLIKLTTGEIKIGKNLNILGPGDDKLTVSGNDASRVFHIFGGNTVTISNLTVAHGKSTGTLAILGTNAGDGSGAGGGGGILNEAGAKLTLNKDTLSDNQAVGAVGFTVVGGALLNLGTATVLSCEFSHNQAIGGGAFDAIGGSAGGAIDNFGGPTGGAKLTVVDSTFCNNQSVSAGGSFYFGLGGAIENDGGLNSFDPTMVKPSTATITNSDFSDNLATGGVNASGNGGALINLASTLTLIGCDVSGNRSVGGGGGDGVTTGDSEGIGGGLMNIFGTLNITACTITCNQAIGGNNTIQSDTDSFAGGAFGGGIQNNSGSTLNITNSLIDGNIAQGGNTTAGPGGCAVGGGIQNGGGFPGAPAPVMNMTNCVVSENSALAGHGGPGSGLVVHNLSGFAFGGGIDTSRGSISTIIGSRITGNEAVGGTGGKNNNGGNGYGGGLSVAFANLAFGQPDNAQLILINSVVSDNEAEGGQGGKGGKGGDGLGGGIYVGATGSATVTSSTIKNNEAESGDGGKGGNDGHGIGGGVYNDGFFSDDILTILAHNHATTR